MDRKDFQADERYFDYLDAVEVTDPEVTKTYRSVTNPIGKTTNSTKIWQQN